MTRMSARAQAQGNALLPRLYRVLPHAARALYAGVFRSVDILQVLVQVRASLERSDCAACKQQQGSQGRG